MKEPTKASTAQDQPKLVGSSSRMVKKCRPKLVSIHEKPVGSGDLSDQFAKGTKSTRNPTFKDQDDKLAQHK